VRERGDERCYNLALLLLSLLAAVVVLMAGGRQIYHHLVKAGDQTDSVSVESASIFKPVSSTAAAAAANVKITEIATDSSVETGEGKRKESKKKKRKDKKKKKKRKKADQGHEESSSYSDAMRDSVVFAYQTVKVVAKLILQLLSGNVPT
jgi:hypothetical protein